MNRSIIRRLQLAIIIALRAYAVDAQTLSNCRPTPPMQPNAKPGVGGLSLSRDGKTLLVAAGDGKIRFVDLNTGEVKRTLTGHTNMVYVATFSPDGLTVAASGNDGMLKLWDVKTGKDLKSLVHRVAPDIDMATYAFVFSRDGKQIFAGNGDGTISVWDVATGEEIRNWKAHENTAFRLVLTSDRHRQLSIRQTEPLQRGAAHHF